jgi:hypothetical protein
MKHHSETDANWMIVRVAGFGKAFKIDLEEVLVKAEVRYQTIQSACSPLVQTQGCPSSSYNQLV